MTAKPRFSLPIAMTPPEQLVPLAQAAEELGYDAITLPDSVFFPETVSAKYPYSEDGGRFWAGDTPFVEPFLAIAAMATVTERLQFFTNVYKLPLRHPLLVAKEVSSLAVLTRNRFALGVGLAWIPEEFTFTATEKATRGQRVNEAIDIIGAVCNGEGPHYVEHHGEHYDFDPVMMSPAPDEKMPIWGSGYADAAMRRATDRCDGWISTQATFEQIEEMSARLLEMRADSPRADQRFDISVFCVEAWNLDTYRRLSEIEGVTDIQVLPWYFYGGDRHDLTVRIDALRRFRDEVLDRL